MASGADFCPYVGLQPFTRRHADYFFGRERDIRIISANACGSRLTILYGPTGAGKSSVLQAGVLPQLGRTPATVVVYFDRWNTPSFVQQLKDLLIATLQPLIDGAVSLDPAASLEDVLQTASENYRGTIILLLDQFDEYLTLYPEESQPGFESELARAINSDDSDATFLIALREDWLAALQRFDIRVPNLFANQLRLLPLGREAARSAIRSPIEAYNRIQKPAQEISIEEEVVDSILAEAVPEEEPGEAAGTGQSVGSIVAGAVELYLVQLVMVRLWDEERRAGSPVLRLETFRRLGGAKKIGEDYVLPVLEALSGDQQDIADSLFQYLVMPQGNKISQTFGNLVQIARRPPDLVRDTLSILTNARIVRRETPPERYEISHDVLCPAVLKWRRRRATAAAERIAAYEAKQATRFRRLSAALLLLLLAVVASVALALTSWRQSWSGVLAATSRIEHVSDPERSIVTALRATYSQRSSQAEEALHAALIASRVRLTLEGHQGSVRRTAVSRDGTQIATAGMDGSARLWDRKSGVLLHAFENIHPGGVLGLVFTADACCLVTSGSDGMTKIWSLTSQREIATLAGHTRPVGDVSVTSSGMLATAGWDGFIRLWHLATRKQVGLLQAQQGKTEFTSVAFNPTGTLLMAGDSAKNISLWDTEQLRLIRSEKLEWPVESVAFSPDGGRIAFAASRTLEVRDAATFKSVLVRTEHTGQINSLAFSPDGDCVATASQDRTARLWPVGEGCSSLTLAGHSESVRSVAFAPDGSLATGSDDGTSRVWETGPSGEEAVIPVRSGVLNSLDVSRDGGLFVTQGLNADSATIRDVRTGREIRTVSAHAGDILDARFSPDGSRVATGSIDGLVHIWSAANGGELNNMAAGEMVHSIRFHPSGKRLAAGGYPNVIIWNLDTSQKTVLYKHGEGQVREVAFSHDGNLVASAGTDGTVQVWPVEGQSPVAILKDKRVFGTVAFTSRTLVVAGADDGTLSFWNFVENSHPRIVQAHRSQVQRIVVSPDLRIVASAGVDGYVHLWDARSAQRKLSIAVGGIQVHDLVFSHNGRLLTTASSDGVVRSFIMHDDELRDFAFTRVTRGSLRKELQAARENWFRYLP